MASGEEVTGLHAFDELDPVSTVSALNVMPEHEEHEEQAAQPRPSAPLPPIGAQPRSGPPNLRSSLPPPPPSARPPAALGRSLPPMTTGRPSPLAGALPRLAPPPPRGGMGGASVPPPPPLTRSSLPPPPPRAVLADDDDELDGDTRVVPNALEQGSDHAPTASQNLAAVGGGYEPLDDDHTSVRPDPSLDGKTVEALPVGAAAAAASGRPIDDTALLELSATTVATDIDMDWDEEDVATELRDEEGGVIAAPVSASGNGNPSPFGQRTLPPSAGRGMFAVPQSPGSFPPPAQDLDWEDEDEALTRVRDSLEQGPVGATAASWSGFPPPVSRQSTVTIDSPVEETPRSRWPWAVLAAAAVIGAAIAARSLIQDDPSVATVTLVTKPGDAEVSIDGRALVGQTSPYMVQDLAPGVDHEILVSKEGYEPQTRRVRVSAGQVMPLDGIELTKLDAGTGFALATVPSGAKVFVDGTLQPGTTPVRFTDLTPGPHKIRVEHRDGKPWESEIALARGQVIELPVANLSSVSAARAQASREHDRADDEPGVAEASSTKRSSSSSSRSQSSKSSRRSGGSSSRSHSAQASAPAPRVASRPAPAPVAAAPALASAGGSGGTLRVNSRPWSQVFVDGRMIGNTPLLNVPLPAGKHKLRLVNPDLGMSKQLTVQIAKGKATTKIVDLQ